MSMRTIVEFNHDYTERLTEPEFLAWLRLALNSGDERYWSELERYGLRKAVMVHHSDERKVVTRQRPSESMSNASNRIPHRTA